MIYQLRLSNNIHIENKWGYTKGMSPFIDYIVEDKSKYPALKDFINPMTGKNWIDRDNDFKMGDSGGILMNIDFVFIGTEIFSRVADFYDKHGVYTLAEKDSPEWREFWARERRRRIQGVIAKCKLMIKDIPAYLSAKTDEDRKALLKPLRITGDHYNYLNYGRIDRFPSDKEIKEFEKQGIYKVKTIAGFPRFWDGDYWNFKLDELISDNSYNLCKAKARRKGFSYKRGSQAANTMNLYKNVTVTLVADNLTYLTDKDATSYMAKVNLDWFENHTDWKRGYLSEDFNKGIELGYRKKSKGMMAFGFRSKLLSIPIGKNESAAVGKKSLETDFEEAGKCFGENTGFIMYDGSIKLVQDIVVGDKLMGPDGTPRTVLATTKGEDELYEVIPLNGIPHIVNSKHDIYVKYRKQYGNINKDILITAPDYINMINKHPRWKENHSLVKTKIDFEHKEVKIDPYVFGLWLGDGDKDTCRITNEDKEVIDYLIEYSNNNNLDYSINDTGSKTAKRITLKRRDGASNNWFRTELERLKVLNNKHIPDCYIYTDRDSRLKLLAGIIDTDGSYDKRKYNFEISQKDYSISYNIAYIARSLGMKTTISEKIINGEVYYRILIMSDCHFIPTKIARKKAEYHKPLQKHVLETRFDIRHIGRGTYYGFEVDNDNLVLLEDFTITHNCPNLQRALDVMKSNSESGAIKIGTIRVYGTGGVKEANWEVFRDCFYIPSKNDMLPMENIWDNKARHTVCGFFFPQIWDCEPFVEDGNSLLFDAWADDKRLKDKARENQKGIEYAVFIGQRANSPSDAFVNTSENMFHSAELIAYISDLQNDESLHFHKDGWYVMENGMIKFIEKPDCIKDNIFGNNKFHDFITDVPHNNKTDVHGCIREFYAPIPNEGDLYFISCDPYRVDKNIKEVTDKHSLFSFQVWMRTNKRVPYSKILVASYCGRLNTMEDNDRLLLYACLRWNAKVLIEAGTGETVSNFKKWGYRNLLLKDPTAFLGIDLNEKSAAIYGVVIGDGDKKLEGLRMLKDYLYEVISINENGVPIYGFTRIKDLSFLYELERFNATGNFDRISSAIVGMYEFKKDSYNLEKSIKTVNQKPKGSLAKMLMGDLN